MKSKVIAFLELASNLRQTGLNLIRVAILIVFVWIGGLKFAHYEADGIVPFVANSPFMSFFYAKEAPEYKQYKNKEGELVLKNRQWHEENRTYVFSYGLGCLIRAIHCLTESHHGQKPPKPLALTAHLPRPSLCHADHF